MWHLGITAEDRERRGGLYQHRHHYDSHSRTQQRKTKEERKEDIPAAVVTCFLRCFLAIYSHVRILRSSLAWLLVPGKFSRNILRYVALYSIAWEDRTKARSWEESRIPQIDFIRRANERMLARSLTME